MRILLIAVIALAVGFTSCREDSDQSSTGTVEIVFMPKYDGNPMVFYENIDAGSNGTVYFQKLEFFLSEIQAQNGDGTVTLADVDYVSMNDLITTELAQQGVSLTFEDVPVGDYDKLMFGVGVTDANNSKEPGDFPTTSPLGLDGNYWASWNSYIFSKIEGQHTPQGGAVGSFLYHGGVNGMYQPRSFSKSFSVKEGETTKIMMHLHGHELFFKAGAEIDVTNDNMTHSGAQGSAAYELAKRSIANLANALHMH